MVKVRQAVIMVGGKGTRLLPLTESCPKPILPVLDRPCLDYLIDSLVQGGIEHVILACGYRSEQMASAIGDGSDRGIRIEYSYETRPMGTAGAIKLLEDRLDDVFVAANGDVFADIDVGKEIDEHIRTGACITISLTPVSNPCEFGIVRTDNEGRILEFKEKPKPEEVFSDLINAGVYVVNKEVLKLVPADTMYDFSKDLVIGLVDRGYRIQGHRINGLWRDVGRPSDLLDANIIMAERTDVAINGKISDSDVIFPAYVGRGASVSGSRLSSSIVSENSEVRGSSLNGSLVMRSSKISGSEISNSILGKGCVITDCKVRDAVLGDGTVATGEEIIGQDVR